MTEEELRKDYYADRPSEPYSDDDRPSDWANIAHYAEENLENAFKRIEELGKENAELKAGRPKWHKVADGDLPKDENDVLVYFGEDWRMCVGRYSPEHKAWETGCDTIEWCEIPERKEK